METAEISTQAKKLSIPERILLAEELWDSIVEEQEKLHLTDVQRQELDRRIDDYNFSPQSGSSWEDVKNRIKNAK
jgi:putative addiction module component (TIGR02574 family)